MYTCYPYLPFITQTLSALLFAYPSKLATDFRITAADSNQREAAQDAEAQSFGDGSAAHGCAAREAGDDHKEGLLCGRGFMYFSTHVYFCKFFRNAMMYTTQINEIFKQNE